MQSRPIFFKDAKIVYFFLQYVQKYNLLQKSFLKSLKMFQTSII